MSMRKNLIRLASTYDSGSFERKALLEMLAGVPGKTLRKAEKADFDKAVRSVSGHKKDHKKTGTKVVVTYTEKGSTPWLIAEKTVDLSDQSTSYKVNPDYLPNGKRWTK